VRREGVRTGNWLSKKQATALLNAPDPDTFVGKRDRALLAVLIGCGIRREEACNLTFERIQMREARWVILDLIGKGGRIRTVPMPAWAKAAIDDWAQAADINSGTVFRIGYNPGPNYQCRERFMLGKPLAAPVIWKAVRRHAKKLGLNIAPHDLRRTYAKLAHKGQSAIEQIQFSLGHSSVQTTEHYLGVEQDLTDAPCDHLGIGTPSVRPKR
jgi:integrase